MQKKFMRYASAFALAVGVSGWATATAQETDPQDDGGPQIRGNTEVVVVTASKRQETVQDIAVAVTAITSELRDEIGLTSVQDYTNFAPGLSYSTSNDRLGMRGVTRTSNNFGIRSGISNYVDGVYYSSAIPAGRAPIFVERVEVVRGPQGTLYGRDSIGGALNLISKRPTEDFEGQLNIGAGNFGQRKMEARMSGPITDWLRYSVAGQRDVQEEGNLTNASGLETEGYRTDGYYIEAQLEGDIGNNLEWWAKYNRLQWDRKGAPGARTSAGNQQPYDTRFLPPGSNWPNGAFAFSGAPSVTNVNMVGNQTTNPTDIFTFNTDYTNLAHLEPTHEIALETVYHAPQFDIKYLGGYVYYHYNLTQDSDGYPVKSYDFNGRTIQNERISDYNENRAWYSNEINFISSGDGPFQWVGGLYQYQENYTQPIYVSEQGNIGGPIASLAALSAFNFNSSLVELPDFTGRNSASGSQIGGDLYFHTNNEAINNAYGAFLQTDYQLTDQWKVTAGVRWSKDVSNGRETARLIDHYAAEAAFEAGYAPFLPGGLPTAQFLIPPRIDVTSALGGADPSTVTPTNPCGFAGRGVDNINTAVASTNCADKTRYGIYMDPATGNAYRDLSSSWNEVTGVLGIDFTPDADTLVYGKYNRGYKPGGLGAAATFGLLINTPYTDKELIDAYELGFKREWYFGNQALTTNAVAFFYDYTDYQISNQIVPDDPDGAGPQPRPPAYTTYVNLPSTQTSGFELETIWRPTENLRFLLNYGWTNPEIQESPSLVNALDRYALDPGAQPLGAPIALPAATAAACAAGTQTINCTPIQGQSVAGNILPNSPKNKIALNATYDWHFEDGSRLTPSLSYFWQDISYSGIFNSSATKIPSWDQVDGRLSWTNGEGNITLIGFVRNIFDELQYDSAGYGLREGNQRDIRPGVCGSTPLNTVDHSGNPLGVLRQDCFTLNNTYRPPRTYGAELQFRF